MNNYVTQATHTPGPWFYNRMGQIYAESDGKDIALLRNDNPLDGALIEAAPDMLAALELINDSLSTAPMQDDDIASLIYPIIARAKAVQS